MKIALLGLNSQDAAALSVLVGRSFPGWEVESFQRLADIPQGTDHAFVVDLPGLGLHRYSDSAGAHLAQALGHRRTLLVTALHDQSWAALDAMLARAPATLFTPKPYKAQDMQLALKRLAAIKVSATPRLSIVPKVALTPVPVPLAAVTAFPTPTPTPVAPMVAPVSPEVPVAGLVPTLRCVVPPTPELPAATTPASLVALTPANLAPAPAPTPALAPAVVEAAVDDEGFDIEEFVTYVHHFNRAASSLFLRKLADALVAGARFEIRLTPQHCMVVCPAEHWVATNTPMVVVHRLVESDGLASVAQLRPVDSETANRLTLRFGMTVQSLDSFLWDLLNPTTASVATTRAHG